MAGDSCQPRVENDELSPQYLQYTLKYGHLYTNLIMDAILKMTIIRLMITIRSERHLPSPRQQQDRLSRLL